MTQQQAGQLRLTPDEQETAVLLSLAYLGQLTLAQLARLLLCSERTLQRRLTQDADSLVKRGLIMRVDQATFDAPRSMPSRGVAGWRLTDDGQRHIRSHAQYPINNLGHDAQYPARPAAMRKGRMAHDSLVAETVICLVEAARARSGGISGVFARFELKLNPFHSAPWADALVILHRNAHETGAHPIPWTRDLPTAEEHDLSFVIELDRATEPLATIGGKAREYAVMVADPRWQQHWAARFGRSWPRILWVVPDARRGTQVQQVWQENWPDGQWYITTFDELRHNAWQRFRAGEQRTVQFFAATAALPAPSPAAAPPPAGTQQQAAGVTPAAPPASVSNLPAPTLRFGLSITSQDAGRLPETTRIQLLDPAGQVVAERTARHGSAQLPRPAVGTALRLRLPELHIELAIGAAHDTVDLRLPAPPLRTPAPDPQFEQLPADLPPRGGASAVARAIDQTYQTCGACAQRINAQADARMQEAAHQGGASRLLLGLLLAYLSIFPVGLALVGQALCLLLRGLLRLARALGWMLGTVWDSAWGAPERRVRTSLARLLLALTLVVWLPLASWDYYDRELRSWPCRARTVDATFWAFTAPTLQSDIVKVRQDSKLRCFTSTAQDDYQVWRRVQVDGQEAWVNDSMLSTK